MSVAPAEINKLFFFFSGKPMITILVVLPPSHIFEESKNFYGCILFSVTHTHFYLVSDAPHHRRARGKPRGQARDCSAEHRQREDGESRSRYQNSVKSSFSLREKQNREGLSCRAGAGAGTGAAPESAAQY